MICIDEKFRAEYRTYRYLSDLMDDELLNRGRDTFRNFMTINSAGKVSTLPSAHQFHMYWRMRFMHFLEECVLRFGPYPNGLSSEFTNKLKIPNPNSKKVQLAISAVDRSILEDGKYLVKYGKHEHLKQMLLSGIVKISPASTYADASLNEATRDTELEFTFRLYRPTHEDLKPYLNQNSTTFPLDGTAIITQTAREDFHLFCLSASYSPHLFDDFNAEACLLITKPIEFRDRLLSVVHDEINARGHTFSAVTYTDPLTESGTGIHITLRKNARYAYQDEMRAVWLPKNRSASLKEQFVSL